MKDRLIFFIKLFKENIIISSSLGFISGIVGSIIFDNKVPIIASLLMLFLVLTLVSELKLKFSLCIYIFFLTLSIYRYISYSQDRVLGFSKGDEVTVSGYLETIENRGVAKRGVVIAKDIHNVDKEISASNPTQRVLVEGSWDININKYDDISLDGYITEIIFKNESKVYSEKNNYLSYLKTKGVGYILKVENIRVVDTKNRKTLLKMLSRAKEYINSRAGASLKEREYALTTGVIYGVEQESQGMYDDIFRKTGTTHIIAVSGYNVSIIISSLGIVNYLTNRKVYMVFSIIFVCIFSIFVGVENIPVIRASIMAILFLFGKLIGKKKTTLNIILFSVIIFLYINPYIIGSLSFQLSFLSTIGLIYFGSKIRKTLKIIPEIIREDVSSTVAAIIYTMPISMMNFNEFSLVAIVSNILILPAVSYLTIIGILFLVITCFSTFIARFFSGFIYIIVEYVYSILEILSGLSFAMVDINEQVSMLVSKVLMVLIMIVTIELIYQNAGFRIKANKKNC